MSLCNSCLVFEEGGTKFVPSETRLHIADFPEIKSRRYCMKGKSKGNYKMFFSIVHWKGSTHICSMEHHGRGSFAF